MHYSGLFPANRPFPIASRHSDSMTLAKQANDMSEANK
jgi:hypothetical protein